MSLTGRKRRPLNRTISHLRDARLFVIAVEGAKREPRYFEIFGSTRIQVQVLPSADHKSSPNHVYQRLRDFIREYQIGADDELWVVIDVDRWEEAELAEVAKHCEQGGIGLAVSNPCFEVWLFLHFAELPVDKIDDCKAMKQILHTVTSGSVDITQLTVKQINAAIDRAQKLDTDQKLRWTDSPGTRVYRLARKLIATSET